MNNFHYAISLAQMLYEVEGDTEDMEEIGLIAYNHIGNKNTRLYRATLNPFYVSGKYVDYKQVGNKLYVNKGLGKVNILYHGILLDDDGLPEINDKEALAIADYIAYVYTYKKAIRTMNRDTMALAKDLKQNWLFHCDAARVPEYVSQEEMNKILDVQSSWGRKVFNKSYKPVM